MTTRVAIYALSIGIFALASAIYGHLVHGEAISAKALFAGILLLPIFGFLICLRWDWAEPLGRQRRAERAARKQREQEDGTA